MHAADPTLLLAWLVLAHLIGDFVLQNERLVVAKTGDGWRGIGGIVAHGLMIALALVPVGLAFGGPGWVALGVISLTHALVDRIKVVLTRRAEAQAVAAARRRLGNGEDGPILGPAWTPVPGVLFVLDQLAHLAITIWAWRSFLGGVPLTDDFVRVVNGALGAEDPAAIHRIALTAVVALALVVVNVRGGMFFVATLVHPREMVEGTELPGDPAPRPAPGPRSWRLRLGPLEARLDSEPAAGEGAGSGSGSGSGGAGPRAGGAGRRRHGRPGGSPPARVGATIGVLERLLIVTFMLTGSEAAIGFVVAAKTLARFRQLDDRDFAEYYLLGTLASVGTAIATGLVARAALATLG